MTLVFHTKLHTLYRLLCVKFSDQFLKYFNLPFWYQHLCHVQSHKWQFFHYTDALGLYLHDFCIALVPMIG